MFHVHEKSEERKRLNGLMAGSPMKVPGAFGELGKRVFENVSKQAWKEWLELQKMLVNENRLNLADKKARDYLAQQMDKHFFGEGADAAQGYVPPARK